MKKLTTTQITELKDIQRKLKVAAQDAGSAIQAAKDKTYQGYVLACECGAMLIKAKKLVAHGEWLKWLKKYFPYSQSTAKEWIIISKSKRHHSGDLKSKNGGIRQAKLMAGIISEDLKVNEHVEEYVPEQPSRVELQRFVAGSNRTLPPDMPIDKGSFVPPKTVILSTSIKPNKAAMISDLKRKTEHFIIDLNNTLRHGVLSADEVEDNSMKRIRDFVKDHFQAKKN